MSDALDTNGYVQYYYDAGTSLQWYKFTVVQLTLSLVRVCNGNAIWYELTIKHLQYSYFGNGQYLLVLQILEDTGILVFISICNRYWKILVKYW